MKRSSIFPPLSIETHEEFLAATIVLDQANGVWQETSWKLTLPKAGKYRIYGNIRIRLQPSSGDGYIVARMYNETDDVLPDNAIQMLGYHGGTTIFQTTVSVERYVEVKKPTVLRFDAYRAGTFEANGSNIMTNEFGASVLGYTFLGV